MHSRASLGRYLLDKEPKKFQGVSKVPAKKKEVIKEEWMVWDEDEMIGYVELEKDVRPKMVEIAGIKYYREKL